MPTATDNEKTLAARARAHRSWAVTENPSHRTAPAREKFNQRFYDEVDPERKLQPAERERRAESARKAYFTELALKSAQSRRRAREATEAATAAEAELEAIGGDAA